MSSALTSEQARFVRDLERGNRRALAGLREQLRKSEALLMRDEKIAFGRIEAAASALVEKSDRPMSPDQAIAAVLRTPRGAALYADYEKARDDVQVALALGDLGMSGRERAVAVAKAAEPDSPAWSAIEKAADRIVAKADGLTRERAIDRVLRDRPELYDRYLRETGIVKDADDPNLVDPTLLVDDEDGLVASTSIPSRRRRFGAEQESVDTTGEEDAIDKAARVLMADDPALSYDSAVDAALTNDPSLYDGYLAKFAGGSLYPTENAPLNSLAADTSDSGQLY